MNITVVPTEEELRRTRAAIAKKVLTRNYSDVILISVYVAFALISYLATPSTWQISVPLVVFGVSSGVWALQAEAKRRTKRTLSRDPHALEEYQVSVQAEGVRVWCAHVDTRFTWDGFTSVRETSEFYLFLRPTGGLAIPKRALDALHDAELRRFVLEHSPDRGESLARELATAVTNP
jgi:hypothetical protein